jgi:hypothetical protein
MARRRLASVEDLEAKFFYDGISEHVLRDALDLGFGFVTAETVELEDEEFALAHFLHLGVAEGGEGALDGLSLGIEDGGLQHDPDVSFHFLYWPQAPGGKISVAGRPAKKDYSSPADFVAARKSSSS